MTVYYVDDGGSNTSPFDTWAKAAPTLAGLQTSIAGSTGTGGNVIYIGADSVSSGDGAAVTITGPTSGGVCSIISATVGTTTFAKSSSNQISTSGTFTMTGNFAVYGVQINGGDTVQFICPTSTSAAQSNFYSEDCTIKPGSNRAFYMYGSGGTTASGNHVHIRLTVSAANDSGAQASEFMKFGNGFHEIIDPSFVDSGSHRTGKIFNTGGGPAIGRLLISGGDVSGLTGTSAIIDQGATLANISINNLKTAASPTWFANSINGGGRICITNSGSADAPEYLRYSCHYGTITSDTTNYRDSGASVEGTHVSWKLVSSSSAQTATPLVTPWMYGVISSTGSKTFAVYVTQDGGAGDLTDAEVWLEIEYLGTSNVAQSTFATDRVGPSGAFSGAAAQTDDSTSTWSGTITETYMQKLSVTATVNEDGLYRARVALGKASTTLYVDPLVTVS